MCVFVPSCRIEIWCFFECVVQNAVEPVEGCLDVEVVPEAVAKDEGVWFLGFCGGEEGLETRDFGRVEWEAEHHFND